jgi:hypothetical protein
MYQTAGRSSAAIFGAIFLCFFLSFGSISCQGHKVVSLSGVQLALGTTIEQPGMFGRTEKQKVDPEPLALLVLLSAAAGFGVSFARGRGSAIADLAAGLAGLLLLLLLKSKLEGQLQQKSGGMVQIDWELGFYLAGLLFLAASALNAYFAFFAQPAGLARAAPGGRFCTQCGSRNPPTNQFCSECGTKLGEEVTRAASG